MTNQDELALGRSGAWTDDEIKRLENMVASGFTNELIAKALGRRLQPVATRVHHLKKRKADEMARARRVWTDDEVATLERMLEAKASRKEIAVILKRSVKGIDQRTTKLRKAKAAESLSDDWVDNLQQRATIFTKPMPQPPEIKPINLSPTQPAWSKPEPQTHRNAAWAAVAVAAGLAGFILGGLAQ